MKAGRTSRTSHVRNLKHQAFNLQAPFSHVSDEALVAAYSDMPALLQVYFFKCGQREACGILHAFLASQEEAKLAVGLAQFATAGVSTQDRVF